MIHDNDEKADRKCRGCLLQDIGDEYNYFCICPKFEEARNKLLPTNIFVKPSVYTFCECMNSKGKRTVAKVAKFAQIILNNFNNTM